MAAQYNVGASYAAGAGVAQSDADAAKWFQRAAEHGLVGSAMTLGMMYEQGLGVEKSEVEAKRWYERAEPKA